MDRIKTIPNAFYDLIVFVIPTLLLVIGGIIGFHGIDFFSSISLNNAGAISTMVFLVIILVASYEYGRIAETWSAIIVQSPLKFISNHTPFLQSKDFLAGHPEALKQLNLSETADGREADKWVIYFYAFVASPVLGSDLLKRYAWEKLSRSSAFSYGILTIMTVLVAIYDHFFPHSIYISGTGSFGTWGYFVVIFILSVVTYYEYYKRNVWNFDLLTKTTPVLLEAYSLLETAQSRIIIQSSDDLISALKSIKNK